MTRAAPRDRLLVNVATLLGEPGGSARDLAFTDLELDLGDDLTLAEPADARFRLTRTNRGLLVDGDVHATLAETCSRCLRPIVVEVAQEIDEEALQSVELTTGGGGGGAGGAGDLRLVGVVEPGAGRELDALERLLSISWATSTTIGHGPLRLGQRRMDVTVDRRAPVRPSEPERGLGRFGQRSGRRPDQLEVGERESRAEPPGSPSSVATLTRKVPGRGPGHDRASGSPAPPDGLGGPQVVDVLVDLAHRLVDDVGRASNGAVRRGGRCPS